MTLIPVTLAALAVLAVAKLRVTPKFDQIEIQVVMTLPDAIGMNINIVAPGTEPAVARCVAIL